MTKPKIRPLGEIVLIQPTKPEKKTASGLYLPEETKSERQQEGKVIALGTSHDISVKKGDVVLFKRYGSSEDIEVAGEKYILVNHKDVLAVVEK